MMVLLASRKAKNLWNQELTGERNGYAALTEGREAELEGGGVLGADRGCLHSSDEEDEDEEQEGVQEEEEEQGRGASENEESALDCSGSRPLLLDSEEEEEQLPELALHLSQQAPPQPLPSTPSHQPAPAAHLHNHTHQTAQPAPPAHLHNHTHQTAQPAPVAEVPPDVFSKAPFRVAQEAAGDVFANAPFPRPPSTVQQPPDVFLQAPFGKRKEAVEVSSQPVQTRPQHFHPATVNPVAPEQALLGQVASQPFRPQALAKYSRHFEGPVPQQPVASLRLVSNMNRQAVLGSGPVGPLHSWTSEVSAVDPFVSAPFRLKAPQEKP